MAVSLTANVGRVNHGSQIPPIVVKAAKGKVFYQGAIVIVAIADGLAYPAGDAAMIATSKVMGVAAVELDTSADASDGDHSVIVDPGTWGDFDTDGGGATIAEDDIGKAFYVKDDATISLTDGGGTLPAGGTIYGIADDGVSVIAQFEVIR